MLHLRAHLPSMECHSVSRTNLGVSSRMRVAQTLRGSLSTLHHAGCIRTGAQERLTCRTIMAVGVWKSARACFSKDQVPHAMRPWRATMLQPDKRRFIQFARRTARGFIRANGAFSAGHIFQLGEQSVISGLLNPASANIRLALGSAQASLAPCDFAVDHLSSNTPDSRTAVNIRNANRCAGYSTPLSAAVRVSEIHQSLKCQRMVGL